MYSSVCRRVAPPHRARLFLLLLPPLLVLALSLPAQEPPPELAIDENRLTALMGDEILQKIADLHLGRLRRAAADYLTQQAYQAVRALLPAPPADPLPLLRQWRDTSAATASAAFHQAVADYSRGMALEIIDSLLFEFDRAAILYGDLQKYLDAVTADDGRPGRQKPERPIPRRHVRRLAGAWPQAESGDSPFAIFRRWRRHVTGESPNPGLEVIFAQGEKYRSRYDFIAGFMEQYQAIGQRLAEVARRVVALPDDEEKGGSVVQ